ncbi:MAG: hypothetical protein ACRD0G_12265 [Acidimicrobiales bacterium]
MAAAPGSPLDTAATTDVLGWARPARARLVQRTRTWLPEPLAQTAALVWHGRRLFLWTQRVSWTHLLTVVNPCLPVADFELVALRATWNCGGYDEWAFHNLTDRLFLGSTLVERVYVGPYAPEWDERRATVLRAVDELHDDLAVSTDTWAALGEWYDDRQRVELVLTAGMYELLSVCLRSIGSPLLWLPSVGTRDPRATVSGPRRRRKPSVASERYRPTETTAVADGVTQEDPGLWVPVDRSRLDVLRFELPRHYRVLESAVRAGARASLSRRDGYLALLRTIWRGGPRSEWAARLALASRAGIDDETLARVASDDPGPHDHDGAVLRAVDEIDAELFVSDETWSRLATRLSPAQRVELCFLVAHYRLIAMALNTLDA